MSIKIICCGSLSIPTALNAVQSDSIIARSQRSEEFCNTIPPIADIGRLGRRCQLCARSESSCTPQSALTPEALMTAAHLAISLSTNFCRYSGDRRSGATTVAPISLQPLLHGRACSMVATVTLWSLWMIAGGVPWARRTRSNCRFRNGQSLLVCGCQFGRVGERSRVRIAIAFTSLASICGRRSVWSGTYSRSGRQSNPASPSTAAIGNVDDIDPDRRIEQPQARCCGEPGPPEPYCIFAWFAFA